MDLSTLWRDIPFSLGVVAVLVLGLIDRVMERQAGVPKFTRQLTMILLTATAAVAALLRATLRELGR